MTGPPKPLEGRLRELRDVCAELTTDRIFDGHVRTIAPGCAYSLANEKPFGRYPIRVVRSGKAALKVAETDATCSSQQPTLSATEHQLGGLCGRSSVDRFQPAAANEELDCAAAGGIRLHSGNVPAPCDQRVTYPDGLVQTSEYLQSSRRR